MSERKPIRIAIASDQAIYLRGLTSLVMSLPGVQLVGEARSSTEIFQLCQMTQPDVILIDLKNALSLGHEVAVQLHKTCPQAKVVLLVETQDESSASQLTNGFPLYFFSRDVSEDEFRVAITQVERDPHRRPESSDNHPVFPHTAEAEEPIEPGDEFGGETGQIEQRNEEILTRELVMAGKIQSDILPEEPPYIKGWEVASKLQPARETSGDFYDFIPLTDHKLGIVVADVTDKGMGAALFMALSSTLIRTYATRFPTLPALTMRAVNERILSDTRGSMFVTAFFGILEPKTGRLTFSNAGHPPGFVISTQRGKESIEPLRPTGMALGVSEQAHWKQKVVRMSPGDLLMLYTDGITEAQNPQGDFFGDDRLLDAVLAKAGCTAEEVQTALLEEVNRFVGHAPRQDDIALIVIRRKESG
jgi:DNA-binding NarL/FixJ family response regulator